ncbi:hypothetical protein LguiB_031062 [Lonicera macranthoides]
MSTPPPPYHPSTTPLNHLLQNILSYDGNVMLAAIIALLLVILFVLLLHVYAKWFLSQANHRNPRTSVLVPHVLGTRFHSFTIDTTLSSIPSKGLDSSLIASLPLFMFKKDNYKPGSETECVICLSVFEEEEVGRKLPNCGHVFHVECIDMWLHSHSTCPVCRDPVVYEDDKFKGDDLRGNENSVELTGGIMENGESTLEIVVGVPSLESENVVVNGGSLSACSSSSSLSSQSSALSGSLKRILSRNNRSENKIHPSSNVSTVPVIIVETPTKSPELWQWSLEL